MVMELTADERRKFRQYCIAEATRNYETALQMSGMENLHGAEMLAVRKSNAYRFVAEDLAQEERMQRAVDALIQEDVDNAF